MTNRAQATRPGECGHWRRWTVILPGAIAGTAAIALGTLGMLGASFGLTSECTDFNEAAHACTALYLWLGAGFIGEWALVLATGGLLAIGLKRPTARRQVAISTWITCALAVAWYATDLYSGFHSYRH